MPVLRFDDLPRQRWPNGRGRKADLAARDGWMASFAWLDADAPFSALPGMDRTITLVEGPLVDGPGFALRFADGTPPLEGRPLLPMRFDGGAAPACTVAGPCLVLNALSERERWTHAVRLLPVAADEVAVLPPEVVAAVLVQGEARCGEAVLRPRDALLPAGETLRATVPVLFWTMALHPA